MLNPIGIIGAGGWGIALAKLLADKGKQVTLWCHRAESFRELQENREIHRPDGYRPAIQRRIYPFYRSRCH